MIKCPHCGYEEPEYDYPDDILEYPRIMNSNTLGDKGEFYTIPIEAKREYGPLSAKYGVEMYLSRRLYACPNCRILFIEEE